MFSFTIPRRYNAGVSFLSQTVVLIPALNEAECVGATIRQWRGLETQTSFAHGAQESILRETRGTNTGQTPETDAGWTPALQRDGPHVRVVDNGSTDDTARVAREAGAEVVSETARGYGAAAWRGLQNPPANTEWILFSSADGSDRLTQDELLQWQQHVDAGFDLIIGDRVTPARSREHLKAVQSFGNKLCCVLIALGWGRRFNDMGSLRLIRRAAIEQLALKDRSFGWNIEMQVRAIEHGLRIVELPVGYHPRAAGQSKISGSVLGTIRAGRSILLMMAKLWLTKRCMKPFRAANRQQLHR